MGKRLQIVSTQSVAGIVWTWSKTGEPLPSVYCWVGEGYWAGWGEGVLEKCHRRKRGGRSAGILSVVSY